jgi:hypothetical protein
VECILEAEEDEVLEHISQMHMEDNEEADQFVLHGGTELETAVENVMNEIDEMDGNDPAE